MVSSAGLTLFAMANVLWKISFVRKRLNTSSLGSLVQLMVTWPAETGFSGIVSVKPAAKGIKRVRALSLANMTLRIKR